ncbi:MAG: hypothetical protein IMZ62_00995, partial [Chloroflexi bacterium]|nr:hypothetical protein [Chloroflexota bacterium]
VPGPGTQSLRRGPLVEAGIYVVTVIMGKERSSKRIVVEEDPRIALPAAALAARHRAIMQTYELSRTALLTLQKISRLRESVSEVLRSPRSVASPDAVRKKAVEFSKSVDGLLARFIAPRLPNAPSETSRPTIIQRLGRLGSDLDGYTSAPTAAQMEEIESLSDLVEETAATIEELMETGQVQLDLRIN